MGMSDLECVEFLHQTDDPRRTDYSEEQQLERLKEYIYDRLPRTRRKGLIRIGEVVEILKFRNRWVRNHVITKFWPDTITYEICVTFRSMIMILVRLGDPLTLESDNFGVEYQFSKKRGTCPRTSIAACQLYVDHLLEVGP